MDLLRSTFPLDEMALSRRALGKMITDPITWVPLVPVVAAYTVFDVPGALALGGGALVLGGVGAFWRKQWGGMMESLRRAAIEDHNRAQNAALTAAAEELRRAGAGRDAHQIEQFLALKKQVEQRLHEEGPMTAQKMQLEQLVDALCFGVRDQLTALARQEARREPADRAGAQAQVDAALATLRTTAADLETILAPGGAVAALRPASLEEMTRRLREEAEIARRVQARLRGEEIAPASDAPPRETE